MKIFARAGLILAVLPSVALAHGEQIVALPIGQFAALVVVAIAVFVLKLSGRQRALVIGIPALTAPILWFVPGLFFFVGDHFGYGMTPWFVIGIAATFAVAATALLVVRFGKKKNAS